MPRMLAFAALLLAVVSCSPAASARERVVGGPCEGCDAVFIGLPATAKIPSTARIAPAGEPGPKLHVDGVVRNTAGTPVAGAIVYAYHTDAKGVYPPDAKTCNTSAQRHGRLRGWARSDAEGRYAFDTIRPASYPETPIPQHIHMHVIEPGRCTYWIDDIVFTDDPVLTPEERERHEQGRGGPGVETPVKGDDGTWRVTRDIVLGAGIADYPG